MISSTKSLPFAIALAIALAPAVLAQGEKTTYPYEIGSFDPTAAELRGTALLSEDQCPDFAIYDYTAADYAILVDALKRYLASHRATRLQFSLYVTFDNYSRIPADAAYDGETKKYWDGLLGQALAEAKAWYRERDESYWTYTCNLHPSVSSSSWGTATAVQLPTDPSSGYDYRVVYLNLTTGVRTGVDNERAVRDEIERLVATGGTFDGCTRENDLMTDYEKVAKIWAWINSNTKFCTCTDSAYGIFLYQDAGGFRGTSFAHAEAFWLLLERAGIASRYVSGKMANYGEDRAWNWVKIADEWYFSDTCYGKNVNGTVMLKGFQDAAAPSYLIDASFDDGSFETTKAATDFVFSAGKPMRDSGSVNARDGGTPLRWKFTDGTLTISGSGAMRDFADGTADVPWKNYLNEITALNVGPGVTYLGAHAFCEVPGLTYAACADALTGVGLGAHVFSDRAEPVAPPSEETEIELPAGIPGDGGTFSAAAQTALREAAATGGLTTVTAVSGTANGKPATTEEVNAALECFSGAGLITADPQTQTLSVGYTFAIAGLTFRDGRLQVVATATAPDGSVLSLTAAAQLSLEEIDLSGQPSGTAHAVTPATGEDGALSFSWTPAADSAAPATRLFRVKVAPKR